MFISVFSSKKLLIATKNKDAFHLHMKYIYTYMKIAQLSCSHIQTRAQSCVYKHRGLHKESEITGIKYMVKVK